MYIMSHVQTVPKYISTKIAQDTDTHTHTHTPDKKAHSKITAEEE